MSNTRKIIFGAGCLAMILVSVGIAKISTYNAFIYLSFLWVLFLLCVVLISKTDLKLWVFYAAIAILAFGLAEAYWAGWFPFKEQAVLIGDVTKQGYFQPDSVLGYRPKRSITASAQKQYAGEVIYSVEYTIGDDGLRTTDFIDNESATPVLFFGGSFTFGEGVEDGETLPARFAKKSRGRFRAYNFGFHGYGPHQMLATLEEKREEAIIGAHQPQFLFYQALVSHVKRCAGRSSWDVTGPQYQLDEAGGVRRAGSFSTPFTGKALEVLARSRVLSKLISFFQRENPDDIHLYVEIVKRSKRLFKERYGGEFYVLLWKLTDNPLYAEMLSELRANGIFVLEVRHILPDFQTDMEKYVLKLPVDYHPNKIAYDRIADYLLSMIDEIEKQNA